MIKPELVSWKPRNWGYNIKELVQWTQAFFQRGLRGWAQEDTWDMGEYLIGIIIPMLKELQFANGCPMNVTQEKWEKILNEMIEGFEAWRKLRDDPFREDGHALKKKKNKGFKLFVKYFDNLWS